LKLKNNKMKYYTFTIYYSKEYKLYDLEIKENNKFYQHFHLTSKKEINKIINNLLNKLK